MLIKTLTKHGNSYALIIDKPIMDLLSIHPDMPLKITTEDGGLKVQPASKEDVEGRFQDSLNEMNKRYPKMLQKLAE